MRDRTRIVQFGPFEANLATGELWREGRRVPLQQQPFRLLTALLERPGDLVTREELRRTLWSDGTFVAFERGLTSAMRKVREALGDRADSPLYVETLPGRGYRFVAVVARAVPAPEPAAPFLPGGPRPAAVPAVVRQPWAGLKVRWAAGLAALAVVAGGHSASRPMTAERLAAADALSAYACVLKSQGRFEEGLGVIQRAHALAPESAKITAEVGFHLHAAGHFDAEFPMLYRAVRLDDRSPDAWLHLGLAHARREDFAKAVEALERARALAGDNRRVQDWLTWARQRQEASRQQAAAEAAFR